MLPETTPWTTPIEPAYGDWILGIRMAVVGRRVFMRPDSVRRHTSRVITGGDLCGRGMGIAIIGLTKRPSEAFGECAAPACKGGTGRGSITLRCPTPQTGQTGSWRLVVTGSGADAGRSFRSSATNRSMAHGRASLYVWERYHPFSKRDVDLHAGIAAGFDITGRRFVFHKMKHPRVQSSF